MKHACSRLAALLVLMSTAAAAPQVVTGRASETAGGVGGNAISRNARISADGTSVVFYGDASNLVPGDTNGVRDVFHKDLASGSIVRVSVGSGGAPQGNGPSQNPDVNQAGDVVVFESFSSNLVPGDTNFQGDVFWHRVPSATTVLLSISSASVQGNGYSAYPSCDDSGNLVAFDSDATNLVTGDTNGLKDVYLRDRVAGLTERISLTALGVEPNGDCWQPAVSPDGRWVAFNSDATNLVPGDTNGVGDVFLKNRLTGALTRVSVGTGGVQGNGQSRDVSLSFDALEISFGSESNNWVAGTTSLFDVYVHERLAGTTALASRHSNGTPGNNACFQSGIARNGRWVAFASYASNLVQTDTNGTSDVFLHDRTTGSTVRVSTGPGGVEANGFCGSLGSLSDDGTRVAYESDATNLIVGDVNGQRDVFHGTRCGTPPSAYCAGKPNSAGCTPTITAVGTPSATAPTPFLVQSRLVLNQKNGLLFYGLAPAALPFAGGIKCVQPPTKRTPVLSSGGNPAPPDDCSGLLTYDFNLRIQSGLDPDLVPGTTVYAQFFYRDPPSSFNSGLTPAACFSITP